MSYEHGITAINLEMTDRVPRTEYSVERHGKTHVFIGNVLYYNQAYKELSKR
ncbi:MAG: hypothetical protein KAJ07_10505 [Planctomycetes bacterium]|nr:hypothetical protein [Planctomycetota bacterium]